MNKILSAGLYLMLILVFIFSLVLVVPVYRQYRKAQQEVAELNKELDRCRAQSLALREEVHALEHQSAAIERVAREKFRYSREGEIVYLYTE